MRKTFVPILVLSFLIQSCSNSPKFTVLSTDKLPPIIKMQFFDDETGICISTYGKENNGHLLKTINGGKDWQEIKTPFINVSTFFFLDKNRGWACSQVYFKETYYSTASYDSVTEVNSKYVIFSSTDGGQNWEAIHDNTFANDICFVDENEGWIVSNNNFIIHTKDGGKNWERQQIIQNEYNTIGFLSSKATKNYNLKAVRFVNNEVGYIAGPGVLLFTTNGGIRWVPQKIESDNGQNTTISVASKDNIWFSGIESGVIHSDNKEVKQFINTDELKDIGFIDKCNPGYGINVLSISFSDKNHGVAVGKEGLVFYTKNGGKSWKQLEIKLNPNAIKYCDDQVSRMKDYTIVASSSSNTFYVYGYEPLAYGELNSVLIKINQ